MRTNYTSIQYLRAVAAILVVVAHTTEYPVTSTADIPFWTGRTGGLGVQIFFVISGFIIATVAGPGRFDPVVFAWRRLIRVVPLYWLATGALFAIALTAPSLFKTTAASVPHLVLSLLFVPHPDPQLGVSDLSPLLKPGWTLNLEMFFYALTALLFWCAGRLRAVLLTIVLGALVSLSFGDKTALGVAAAYASPNLVAFLCGVWLAQGLAWGTRGDRRAGIVGATAGITVAATAVIGLYCFAGTARETYLTLAVAPLIVLAALLVERAGMLPAWPWLKRIGDASYSLYLSHMFSVGLTWAVIRKLFPTTDPIVHAGGVPISIAVAIATALVCFQLVETPILRLAKRAGPAAIKAGSGVPGRTVAPWRATRA